jgi:MFS family permease
LLTLTLLGANACAVIATNAWFSWMTDLIPPTIRGAYYGRRNSYLGFTSLVTLFLGSQILSYCRAEGYGPFGYTICFSVAIVSALFAGFTLRRQHEPEVKPPPRIKFADLYRITKSRPLLMDYIRFFSIWQFSLGVSAAYFGVYMVKGLDMNPAMMGYQALIASFMALLGSRIWGRARDRIGDRAVLVSSGLVICLNVWIWLIPVRGFLLPVWILSVFAGFGWAGFNVATFNWPQELCGEEDRQYTFGVLGMLSGPAFVAGSLLGGALTTYLPEVLFHLGPLQFNSYMFVFVCSTVGRTIALILLCRWTRRHDPELRGFWRCIWDSFGAMRSKED